MYRVQAERQRWSNDEIGLLISKRADHDPVFYVAKPIELRPLEPGERVEGPTLSLRLREAQALMDDLWQAGLRPTEGSGSAGSLATTERHLGDMSQVAKEWRELAQHLVKVVIPPVGIRNEFASGHDMLNKLREPK